MQARASFESETLALQVFTDLSKIAGLTEEWEALLTRSSCNRAFSSAHWFIATCVANPSFQPYVIIARRGAELAGLLPLVLTDEGRVATFPSYLTDYSDAIVARDDFTVVAGLLDHARAAPDGYRRLVLRHIRRDSNCVRAIQMQKSGSEDDNAFREMVGCHYLRLPATYDDFLRTKDSRFRKRLKRLQALAGQSNFVVSELVPDNFPPNKLPDVFLSLHLARQRARSCFESAAAQTFAQEVISDLFEKGIVRACALMKDERVVAIDLYTMGDQSLGAWNGGFLAEAEHCSPGKLLIDAGIKLACALGLDEYDFMRGTEGYKNSWANGTRSVGSIELSVAGESSFVHSS
ncbi:MAG TPA: GNAT family N-acetyltransferase [Pyrinomonadaceae bacterium]|nr:GNAT family N-acetyltransferase [Pyrinomonadaceae bacterium]